MPAAGRPDKPFLTDPRGRARYAVHQAIIARRLPHLLDTRCAGCGGTAAVYHHHRGYAPAHSLDVVALCYRCHVAAHHPPVDVQAPPEPPCPPRDTRWRRSHADGRVWLWLDGRKTRFYTLAGVRRFGGDWPWALYEHRSTPSGLTEVWWHRLVKGCDTRRKLEAWVRSAAERGDLD